MSMDYYIAESHVSIPAENIPEINAFLAQKYGFEPVGVVKLTHKDALGTAADIEGWKVLYDYDGNVKEIRRKFEYDNTDGLNWLRTIAKWVDAGSYVEVMVEHDYSYRVMFNGTR